MDRRFELTERINAAASANETATGSRSVAVVFTIVSSNYSAQAKVLMDSVQRAEPGVVRVIVAADNLLQPEFEGHVAIFAEDTQAPWRDMSAYYDALEYNTAVKPFCFKLLFDQANVDKVVYLDPDILIFRPLTPVFEALDQFDITLTPHMTTPLGVDGRTPDDHAILRSGVYNLGFLGLRRSTDADAFVDWWADRCRFDCRVAFEEGLFTDQRWVDLAPGFFESPAILRHPGLNLGYWNLPSRRLERKADAWTVDDQPLIFFHYSGFDPRSPLALSKHQTRVEVDRGSPLADLLARYANALDNAGYRTSHQRPYRFTGLESGRPLTGLARRTILAATRAGIVTSACDLSAWLDSVDPIATAEQRGRMTRIVSQLWEETPGAANRFPLASPDGRAAWAAYVKQNAKSLGVDMESQAAFAALGDNEAAAPNGQTQPPASALEAWPPACTALWRIEPELRTILPNPQASDRLEALAYCLGPAALRGRFDPRDLRQDEDFGPDGGLALARRAVRLSTPFLDSRFRRDDPLAQLLCGAFGISTLAAWPDKLANRVKSEIGLKDDGGPLGTPGVLRRIVLSRPDLQRAFPQSALPLRLANWFLRLGLAEYGCQFDALPASTRKNLAIWLASLRRS